MKNKSLICPILAVAFVLFSCLYVLPPLPKTPFESNPQGRVLGYPGEVNKYGFVSSPKKIFGFISSNYLGSDSNYHYSLEAITILGPDSISRTPLDIYNSVTLESNVWSALPYVNSQGEAFIAYFKGSSTTMSVWSSASNNIFQVTFSVIPGTLQAMNIDSSRNLLCAFLDANFVKFYKVNTTDHTYMPLSTGSINANEILEIGFLEDNKIYAITNSTSNQITENEIKLDGSTPLPNFIGSLSSGVRKFVSLKSPDGKNKSCIFNDVNSTYFYSAQKTNGLWYGASISIYLDHPNTLFGAMSDSTGSIYVASVPIYSGGEWEYQIRQFKDINSPSPFMDQKIKTYFWVDTARPIHFFLLENGQKSIVAIRPGVMDYVSGMMFQFYSEMK